MATQTAPDTIRLTQLARCAGCAAKLGAADLAAALEGLPVRRHPQLLVGHETMDDAGIFVINDEMALVQTVDFFAPIVDDPYTFGQVAAANALSDVYAMGGEPLTAMNVMGFPAGSLPLDVMREILRGGGDKVHEAGAVVVGGHTIIDEELKFGVSVTGRVHPKKILTNAAAKVGDRLVLSKSIGTALLATVAKKGTLPDAEMKGLTDSMTTLNKHASKVALELGARCATDVTGFGLLGHSSHIAKASGVTVRIFVKQVPILPGAREAAERGVRTGGADRNAKFLEGRVDWGRTSDVDRVLMVDPQTSGGLLVALAPDNVKKFLSRVPGSAEVGEVVAKGPTAIALA